MSYEKALVLTLMKKKENTWADESGTIKFFITNGYFLIGEVETKECNVLLFSIDPKMSLTDAAKEAKIKLEKKPNQKKGENKSDK